MNAEVAEYAEESQESRNCVSSASSALELPASLRFTSVLSVTSVVKIAITEH